MTATTLENLAQVKEASENPIPLLLEGSTGCGKSACIMEAARQRGVTCLRLNMSRCDLLFLGLCAYVCVCVGGCWAGETGGILYMLPLTKVDTDCLPLYVGPPTLHQPCHRRRLDRQGDDGGTRLVQVCQAAVHGGL
jgi:hypothetical protein